MVSFLVGFVARLFFVGFSEHLIVMVIFGRNVPFLLLLRFVKTLSLRRIVLGACFGMVGFLCYLVYMVLFLGPSVHLRVLVTLLKLRLGVTLLVLLLNGVSLMIMTETGLLPWSLINPNVWSDGSLVLDHVTGVSSSGAGSLHTNPSLFGMIGGGVMLILFAVRVMFSPVEVSVPGILQSVQRAEMWGVILALQSSGTVHLGVDSLSVVRHVGRLLDGHRGSVPCELFKDGDLLLLIDRMHRLWGLNTVRVTKVKGHADEDMVLHGRVREVDRFGNNAADEAADFGRRRVGNAVIDARRNLSGVCGRWYPVILDLNRFFVAISRAVVNRDGKDGTAPDPLVWSAGALPERRRLVHAVRDRAFLPGPPGNLGFGMGSYSCICYLC